MSRIYALYKGEQNLADGTLEEIARKTGKTYRSLKWMTYPIYKRRIQQRIPQDRGLGAGGYWRGE